ncbi:acyl transferase/acyl hydrolase/lysophospholipase [Coprinopsis sp. MPI-PUGE-AT-0042]|nr:acyl transferase/acyl hydrolase/lysophospholipase [Coprinopsis sp. MPI-PUGE-AT-0042]
MASNSCFVKSDTNDLMYKLWFATAMFDEWAIKQLEAIQLPTCSCCQENRTEVIAEGESLSWFDWVILETPFETAPKVTNGVFDIDISDEAVYSQQIAQIKVCLEPGNAIGVRVCAQYPGWENYAQSGQMIVRISNESMYYYCSAPPYKEHRPLRLLSLNGGGVRGVSSLRSLRKIMEEVANLEGKKTVKPCEYFDIMAGTSTGGLMALMLGRLRMSIDECEKAYDTISKNVYGTKSGWFVRGEKSAFTLGSYIYEAGPLKEAIKEIVKDRLGNPNAFMKEGSDPAGKVCALSFPSCDNYVAPRPASSVNVTAPPPSCSIGPVQEPVQSSSQGIQDTHIQQSIHGADVEILSPKLLNNYPKLSAN